MSGQFVLFTAGGDLYAVDADAVAEVTPCAAVTPVPFTPDYVDGVVTVGGRIAPQIDFLKRIGSSKVLIGKGQLLVLEGKAGPFALKVDAASTMAAIPPEGLAPSDSDHRHVLGEFFWEGRLAVALAVDGLGLEDVAAPPPASEQQMLGTLRASRRDASRSRDEFSGVVVEAGGDRYALPLDRVREVAPAREIRPLPYAPGALAGVFNLRGQPLAALSLSALLNAVPGAGCEQAVIVDTGFGPAALLVDAVIGLRRFGAAVRRAQAESHAHASRYVLDDKGRIVVIVDLGALLDEESLAACKPFMPQAGGGDRARAAAPTRRFLSMSVGQEAWALDLQRVERVSEWRPPQPAPAPEGVDADPFGLDGVIDIGGEILPVVDLGRRLGMTGGPAPGSGPGAPPGAYVVARTQGGPAAFMVHRLHRIVDIPEDRLEIFGEGRRRFVEGVGEMDGRLVSLLAVDQALTV